MKVKVIVIFILMALLIGSLVGTATGKSLYLVANHHTRQFDAYNINPPGSVPPITYQARYNLTHAGDPADVEVWVDIGTVPPEGALFITSEFDYGVELVDAKTMTSLGWVTGGYGLAGIKINEFENVVYTVERMTNDLYIYDWDPVAKTLTLRPGYPVDLPNCHPSGAIGLALDEIHGFLYVADAQSGVVRQYDIATLTEVSNFAPSIPPIGIAVDRLRGFVYTTHPDGSCAWLPQTGPYMLLSKYNLATNVETTVNMGHGGMGIAVDEVTGYVYVTGGCSGDNLSIWDSSLNFLYSTGDLGDPAGIGIGNIGAGLDLAKNDVVAGYGIQIGQTFPYEITYSNNNSFDITGVTIVDNLPVQLDFVSETKGGVPGTGVYDPVAKTVTWNIGTILAGQSGPDIELVVSVNQNAIPGSTIYNYCTIESDQTPPVTVEGKDPDNPFPGEPGNYILYPKPTLIAPLEGAIMDNGCADQSDDMIWDFVWSNCPGATKYHLYVYHPGSQFAAIDNQNITDSFYQSICSPCYVAEVNRFGWTWKVRAMIGGQWGEWSDSLTFDVEPLNSDCQNTAKIQVLPKVWYTSWGNPHTGRIRCWIGELAGGYDVTQINRSTLRLNGTVPIYGITYRIIPSWPGFTGSVLEVAFDRYSSYMSLGSVIPGNQYPVTITGEFNDGVDFSGETMITVQTALPKLIGEAEIPESFSLIQNYPNPFNPETDISYALPSDCKVNLTIYNLLGQKVKTLVNEPQTAGYKTTHWNGRDEQGNLVSSGIYFYKLNAGEYTDTKKMVMTK